jgi:uncharacterized protein (DUF2384 family)
MPIEIFISYAREDESLLHSLKMYLIRLRRQGLIDIWDDHEISAGKERFQQIHDHLENAQIILLLVSPDSLASEHFYNIEVTRAVERHNQGKARVIPIILRRSDWRDELFGKLQPLPIDGRPITIWSDQDEAFLNVVEGISKVVGEFSANTQEQDQATALITEVRKEMDQLTLITKAREEMVHLIRLYKDLRYFILASFDKTRNIESVMQSMKEWSKRAEYTSREITSFLLSLDESERLAGLAILRARKDVDLQSIDNFEQMLDFMEKPHSPFEHYHTLEVLKGMKPHLSDQQQDKLRGAVCNHIYDRSTDSEHWPTFCRETLG